MQVATFSPKTNIQGAPYMQADPEGEYVRLEAYQDIAAQLSTAQTTAAALEKKDVAIKAAADAEP